MPIDLPSLTKANSGVKAGVTNYTFNITVPAGENRYLVVNVQCRDNDNPTNRPITGITADGVAMALGKARSFTDTDGDDTRAEQWVLFAPNVGSIVISVTHTGSVDHSYATAIAFCGAEQSNTPNATQEDDNEFGTDPSLSITTTKPGCIVIDSCYDQDGADLTPGTGQTAIEQGGVNGGGDRAISSYKVVGPAGATTMSWTNGGSADANVQVAIAIAPFFASKSLPATGAG